MSRGCGAESSVKLDYQGLRLSDAVFGSVDVAGSVTEIAVDRVRGGLSRQLRRVDS